MILRAVSIIVTASLLGFLAGFRVLGDGPDYAGYAEIYDDMRIDDPLEFLRFEPGYVLLSFIFKFALNLEFAVFFSFLSSFALVVKFLLFSKTERPALAILFYCCCWYPLHEYTQIRVVVAMSFVLLGTYFFFQRRYIAFSAAFALGSAFHASILLLFGAVPFAYFLSRFRLLVVVPAIAVAAISLAALSPAMFAIAATLNPLTEGYIANLDDAGVTIFSSLNILTVGCLAAIFFARSLHNRVDYTLFILVVFGLGAAVAFAPVPVFSHRIKEMLFVFLVPLAFNTRLTPRALGQYTLAFALAGWTLYTFISYGVIGFRG